MGPITEEFMEGYNCLIFMFSYMYKRKMDMVATLGLFKVMNFEKTFSP